VTDFLPAERARGITIQSAAISFNWPPAPHSTESPGAGVKQDVLNVDTPLTLPRSSVPHNINLIDTPGHADFTFEVLRSLRILDGAVCILDGVAGVEAQTEQVWKQANHYSIPRIAYVNKLDRDGAAFGRTVREIAVRLHSFPAVCQVPWWKNEDGPLIGVGDAIHLRGLCWEEGGDGKAVQMLSLKELQTQNSKLAEEVTKARVALVELLSEHDDEMVEKFLEHDEDHMAIPPQDIIESLRRAVLKDKQEIIPVFAGASFRNIGVQPLLDAVVDLLPAPGERPDPEISLAGSHGGLQQLLSGDLSLKEVIEKSEEGLQKSRPNKKKTTAVVQNLAACALAFKVVNDPKRGVLVYVRVYSGAITRMSPLFNTNLNLTEKAPRILKMYASDAVEVESIPAGQIGVIVGLKQARTGDTLITYTGANPKSGPPEPLNSLQLRPIVVPPPVFFTSVEPNSLSEERAVAETLNILLREDPSLHVNQDEESGQTLLSGMGELHLEIARDRLINDFKAKATTGKIDIGYRETILGDSGSHTEHLDREIGGSKIHASSTASVSPLDENMEIATIPGQTAVDLESNSLVIRHPTIDHDGKPIDSDYKGIPGHLSMSAIISAIQTGASAALARGPTQPYPVHSVQVEVELEPDSQLFADTTASAISSATRRAVQVALKAAAQNAGSIMMEPVMSVTINVNESDMGNVVHDLSSARGGQVVALDADDAETGQSGLLEDTSPLIIDPRKIYAPPDPFDATGGADAAFASAVGDKQRQIIARVPLKEMVGYLKHLRSLTSGRGTFFMKVDRFERMSSARQRSVLTELRGDLY
jgi:elongation factor G